MNRAHVELVDGIGRLVHDRPLRSVRVQRRAQCAEAGHPFAGDVLSAFCRLGWASCAGVAS